MKNSADPGCGQDGLEYMISGDTVRPARPSRMAGDGADYRVNRISTTDFAPRHRFDAWRETAFRLVDLTSFTGPECSFQGRYSWVSGEYGKFCTYAGSAHQTRAKRRDDMGGEWTVLMLLQEGAVELQSKTGQRVQLQAGSLGVFNYSTQDYCRWSNSREIHLLLPRAVVLRALGPAADRIGFATLLDDNGMAPFMRSQMVLFDRQAAVLNHSELVAMLDVTINMALLLLGNVLRQGVADGAATQSALFAAALRCIDAYSHKSDFNVNALACALGWSRAKLYRVFAAQDMAVHSVLRDVRLNRARILIENSLVGTAIGTLAYACGFADHSSFGKMFKERFGVAPGEWRAHCHSAKRKLQTSPGAADLPHGIAAMNVAFSNESKELILRQQ